ncbi:hypothetical protein B0J18DRAFT_387256 [Chaetomium sp. MPI-SDFR-AT-0129]|nr:hypothetical protein B0J18DRAFT_387256 [Chaetomium sp. MPI-SDFR-AT-0129]
MPRSSNAKRALFLPGLHLNPGQVFSSQAVAERMYGLLVGNEVHQGGDKHLGEVQKRVAKILFAIFDICVARVPMFLGLSDPALAWQVVAGAVAEQCNCTNATTDISELVTVFADARRSFLNRPHDVMPVAGVGSSLTAIIDRWLEATAESNWASSSQQTTTTTAAINTTLASRPVSSAPPALDKLFAGVNLIDTQVSGREADDTHDWPPSHLATTMAGFLVHPGLREQLRGVCWDNKGIMPGLPTDRSDPFRVRLFLGWVASAYTPPPGHHHDQQMRQAYGIDSGRPLALYMAPIAFFNNGERQGWYQDSGCQSKLFGHLDGFLSFAADAFATGGKRTVLGLMTPFFATQQEARALQKSHMRRFGMAVMLRAVERQGVTGLQAAFFCPWDKHPSIKKTWRPYEWNVLLWKEKVLGAVEKWAAGCGMPVHEGYMGGSTTAWKGKDHDSVEMCAGWLWRAMEKPEKTLPSFLEEDNYEWEECLFNKVESWMRAEEEHGGDEMDVDQDM